MSHSIPDPSASSNIPYGYCHCGCGELAPIASKTDTARNHIKGRPIRYILHHLRSHFPTIAEQFQAYCSDGEPDACWEWQGTRLAFGHGAFCHKRRHYLAHRVAYELHFGPIPDGLWVLHKCDNPACCNPKHLFLGTGANNATDMWSKGRGKGGFVGGEAHPNAKLTNAQVKEIRLLKDSGLYQREVGAMYGVSPATVSSIWLGKTHKVCDSPNDAKRALLQIRHDGTEPTQP